MAGLESIRFDAGVGVVPAADDDEMICVGEPMADVVCVKVVAPLTLFVEFDDGVKGEVRFEDSHLYGVFEKLRDSEFFAQVAILHGAVSWPNEDVDLAPDNMHIHLKRDGHWVLN